MDSVITLDEVLEVFPRPLMDEESGRAYALVEQCLELIELEFARRGRVLGAELKTSRWLTLAVRQAVRVMFSQAVLIGEDVGRASISSSTGVQSDSVTYSQGIPIIWGGAGMTADVLGLLGLLDGLPRGAGGTVVPFGRTRGRSTSAEFAQREGDCGFY